MTFEDVQVGRSYSMPSGVNRKVVAIGEGDNGWKWVRLETINGKCPGTRSRESIQYFVSVAEPMDGACQ